MKRARMIPAALLASIALLSLTAAPPALAAAPAPNLALHTFATPTSFSEADGKLCKESPGNPYVSRCDEYQVTATNSGSLASSGAITFTDTLPANLEVIAVQAELKRLSTSPICLFGSASGCANDCTVEAARIIKCKLSLIEIPPSKAAVALKVNPDETLALLIQTVVKPGASGEEVNTATISGGGSPASEEQKPLVLDAPPAPFGLDSAFASLTASDGSSDTLAGDHPYEFRTRLDLNTVVRLSPAATLQPTSVKDPRDVIVDLPPGLVGAATATPYCTLAQLSSLVSCPPDTRVGQILSDPLSNASVNGPIYNIAPEAGVAAEFGFEDLLDNVHVIYASVAPTPEGYVTRAITREIPQIPLADVVATFFGDPQSKNGGPAAPPMFSNSANCDGRPLTTHIYMDSWQAPGSYNADDSPNLTDPNWASASASSPAVEGCDQLHFEPSIKATPQSSQADSPTGLDVNIALPQPQGAEELTTPPLKDALVTLPEGMTVNPSSANGLQACSLAQVGISAEGLPNAAPPACPEASKIGTVELETPALPSEVCKEQGPSPQFKNLSECPEPSEREKVPLKGSIYVARQLENPFGSLLAIYIVIDDQRTGVVVKLAGEVKPNQSTGQLRTVVSNSPQFPFSELRTHFFAGASASLRTPATCGPYTLTSELTPWSAPQSGPAATPQSTFEVSQGPGGGACAHSPGEEPNSPSFSAGSEAPSASAFSPLIVHLSREDGSQNFSRIDVTLPPGASGRIAGIPRCSEAQIAQAQARSRPGEGALEAQGPSCPQSSAIGTVTVGAGAGPRPYYVTGNAYLAGPYEGAPFSAVFITPAIAGPFDLGVVLVRAALRIDPSTAQVTTASDQLPSILQGIPLDIRSVSVNVSRPGFTLNPSNCNPMSVTGRELSMLGQSAPLSARFQVGGCQGLPFKPKLTAGVSGKASKANGAAFTVNVSAPGLGQANIAKVQLQLPKTLPSRLTTIQKACPAATFEANPASCGEGSVIGSGTIHTPLLDSPLTGPAYLVSHGNAAFPDVEFVLQGEGVLLILDGKTDIKKGITYSRFESTPDAPFTTFQASLPAGPHSALTANVPQKERFSLCNAAPSLVMPTTIVAQSGAVIKQSTKIALSGCPKKHKLTNKQKLNKALKACHRKKGSKRKACEAQAHRRYPVKKGKGGGRKG